MVISIMGCGWLGLPLAGRLIHAGHTILGSTTSKNKIADLESLGIQPFRLSLEDLGVTIPSFLEADLLIINIPSKNINGFKNLVHHIERSSLKKVILVSSTSVYRASNQTVTETSPTNSSPLITIERFFKDNDHFSTTIIRFSGLIGYDRRPGNWFANGKKIPNPEGFVNMIHRDDCLAIIERIIETDLWDQTLNAAADTHPTRKDFYVKAKTVAGLPLPQFEQTRITTYKIVSNKKLKTLLQYKFKFGDVLKLEEIP